jgi:hypothetical protein
MRRRGIHVVDHVYPGGKGVKDFADIIKTSFSNQH